MKNTCPFSGKHIRDIKHPVILVKDHDKRVRDYGIQLNDFNKKLFTQAPLASAPASAAPSIMPPAIHAITKIEEFFYEQSACMHDQVYELSNLVSHFFRQNPLDTIRYNGTYYDLSAKTLSKPSPDTRKTPLGIYIQTNAFSTDFTNEDYMITSAWDMFPYFFSIPALSYPAGKDDNDLSYHPSILSPQIHPTRENTFLQYSDGEVGSNANARDIKIRTHRQTAEWYSYFASALNAPFDVSPYHFNNFHILNQKSMFCRLPPGTTRKEIDKDSEALYALIMENFCHPVIIQSPIKSPTSSPFHHSEEDTSLPNTPLLDSVDDPVQITDHILNIKSMRQNQQQQMTRKQGVVVEFFDLISSIAFDQNDPTPIQHPTCPTCQSLISDIRPIRKDTYMYDYRHPSIATSSDYYAMLKTNAILLSLDRDPPLMGHIPPTRVFFGENHELVAVPFFRFVHFFGFSRFDLSADPPDMQRFLGRPESLRYKAQDYHQIHHIRGESASRYISEIRDAFIKKWTFPLQDVSANDLSIFFKENNPSLFKKCIALRDPESEPFFQRRTEGGATITHPNIWIKHQDLVDDIMQNIDINHRRTPEQKKEDSRTGRPQDSTLMNNLYALFCRLSDVLGAFVVPIARDRTNRVTFDSDAAFFTHMKNMEQKNIFSSEQYLKDRQRGYDNEASDLDEEFSI